MKFLKRLITEAAADNMRIALSVKEDFMTADASLPDYAQRVTLSPEPTCDWCGDPDPLWVYASSRMSTGEMRQCLRWTACERCSSLVDKNHWDALERRTIARYKKFFAAKYERDFGHSMARVPDSLITEAVQHSLKQFHDYAVVIFDPGPGAGKSDPARS